MIYAIAKFLSGLFGVDIGKMQRIVLIGFIALIGLVMLIFVLSVRSCLKREPKLDQEQIQRAQKAIAEQNREEMQKVLAESDAKEKVAEQVEYNAKAASINAQRESREKWANATTDEMAAELERRAKQ